MGIEVQWKHIGLAPIVNYYKLSSNIICLPDSHSTHWSSIGADYETVQKCCTVDGEP